jgi:tripartite-type tricarboxylate transporter receptor subunit TctC
MLSAMLSGLIAFTPTTVAQSKPWPTERPIQIHIGQAAGFAPDILTRWLAEALSAELGQSVVVINKASAGGRPMLNELRRTAPDGYTFAHVFWHMTSTWPALFSDLEFNPAEDFAHVGTFVKGPQAIVSSPSSGIKSVNDLMTQAPKTKPAMQYGTDGATSPGTIFMSLISAEKNMGLEMVPFKPQDAVPTLLRGDVPVLIGGVMDVAEQVKSGAAIPLAVTGTERLAMWPNVPTLSEFGIKHLDAGVWSGMLAPKGTPPEILNRMNDAMRKIANSPSMKSKFDATGRTAWVTGPEQMQNVIREEIPLWSGIIKRAGLKIN